MKQNTLHCILSSIDEQMHALRCESAVTKFYPSIEDITLKWIPLPGNMTGLRPYAHLTRVSDNRTVLVEAYQILEPKDFEDMFEYVARLVDHCEYLDNHACFIEIETSKAS